MTRREHSRRSKENGSSTSSSRSDASTTSSMFNDRSLVRYYQDHSGPYSDRPARLPESRGYNGYGESCSSFGSADTYASTSPSKEALSRYSKYEVPLTPYDVYPSNAVPSTSADFAEFFAANRRLLIHHDDATSDGNMNLRIDTEVFDSNYRSRNLILFHLRMYDLKDRKFSLRRYCRDSGREICKSSRKYAPGPPSTSAVSTIQQSLGHTFQQLRLRNEKYVSQLSGAADQGYHRDAGEDEAPSHYPAETVISKTAQSPAKSIQLEFSNYARITMNKRGLRRSKRFEYEYWGTKYEWKRHVHRDGHYEEVSYHLVTNRSSKSIAHITPDTLTVKEAQDEEDSGGWIPPCTMQISDPDVFRNLTNVADTIVATGLLALIDDCIDRRWHDKRTFHLDLPDPQATNYLEPGLLVDEIFNRQVGVPGRGS